MQNQNTTPVVNGIVLKVEAGQALFCDKGKLRFVNPAPLSVYQAAAEKGITLVNVNSIRGREITARIPNYKPR